VASMTVNVTVAKIKPRNFKPRRSAMIVPSFCPRLYLTGTGSK
jgi:hypothetical protein